MRKWFAIILLTALLGGAWIYATRIPLEPALAAGAQPRANFPAPAFALTTLDGSPLSSDSLRGQVVLVNFWATWCVPCRTEMPVLQSVYAERRAEGFTVIAINVAEDRDTIAPFVKEFHLTFPILLDRDTAVAKTFNVNGIPASFFIDRAGIIRTVYLGAMSRAYVESQVTPLLETR